MLSEGCVILDTNTLAWLEDDERREYIVHNLRTAGWDIWPSGLNVLEAYQTRNSAVRRRLLRTIQKLAEGRAVLPWPHDILEQTATALKSNRPRFVVGSSQLEHLFETAESEQEQYRIAAEATLEDQEARFAELHAEARRTIRRFFKAQGRKTTWPTAADFLREVWMAPGNINDFVAALWRHFGHAEPAPIELLLQQETWRLFFEAYGAAVFERVMLERPPRPVHHNNIIQLIYLGGRPRRMIVTADEPLIRAARSVLAGRYNSAWVVHIRDFIRT